MPATSTLLHLDRQAAEAFALGEPVSAGRTFILKNNLAHLIDQSTQVLINWVATSVAGATNDSYQLRREGDPVLTNAYVPRIWSQEFPLTWLRADRPVNLDVLVQVATFQVVEPSDNDLNVRARVVPARFAIGDDAAPAFADQVVTATTTSASPTALLDCQWALAVPAPQLGEPADLGLVALEEGDIVVSPIAAMMRLEITLAEDGVSVDTIHEIVGVYVREYA